MVLGCHPDVADVALLGLPDIEWEAQGSIVVL